MRLAPRTSELLVATTDRPRSPGFLLLLGVLLFGAPFWTSGLGIVGLMLLLLVLDRFAYRIRRSRPTAGRLSIHAPHLHNARPGRNITLTAAAWAHADPDAAAPVLSAPDGDVLIWSRPEPEALLSLLRGPMAFAVLLVGGHVLLDGILGARLQTGLGWGDAAVTTALLVLPLLLSHQVHRLIGSPLRRRLGQEHHLLFTGRAAVLVQGDERQRFSLDDVTAIERLGRAVVLHLLDGRQLSLVTTDPAVLAERIGGRIGPLADPEPPEQVRELRVLRERA